MAKTAAKEKDSFGTLTVHHTNPDLQHRGLKGVNIVISFEEGLKLHLALWQALARLSTFNRATKAGKNAAVHLRLFGGTTGGTITVFQGTLVQRARRSRGAGV